MYQTTSVHNMLLQNRCNVPNLHVDDRDEGDEGDERGEGDKRFVYYLTLVIIGAKHYCSHLALTSSTDAPPNHKPLKAFDIFIFNIYLLAQPAHGYDQHGGRRMFACGAREGVDNAKHLNAHR